jgi:sporulation protein YqfC
MTLKMMENLKRRLAEALELPKDVMLDLPVVTLVGNEEMLLSNHKGVLEYAAGMVRISTSLGVLKVAGSDLVLKTIDAENVAVVGKIEGVFLC